ncbi:protein BEAN1 [Peromyscus eremicus]|uniref:protein BEAN1 n=1 Tax=Peromyscus eremicus TaxID=42410 RepID=UPI0027DC1DAC|nr:protein BEAN1 [Peromyscus eremicus]XP_059118609.1 protein BEAN1 [Peromyscus eremicus]
MHSHSSHRMSYACSPAEDWPPPLDISSDGDVDVTVLRELYPDSPPGYEECVGPGATQLYIPTDAPPPYSLTDSCLMLNGALNSGSGHGHSQHQQEQRTQGQSGLHTVSMDTLPPYEAVCGAGSPSDLLPLPGPEPQPPNSQGSPTPTQAPTASPERIVSEEPQCHHPATYRVEKPVWWPRHDLEVLTAHRAPCCFNVLSLAVLVGLAQTPTPSDRGRTGPWACVMEEGHSSSHVHARIGSSRKTRYG